MYIIAVKNINNEIQQVAQCETIEQAQQIHKALNSRYKFETYLYKNKISKWFIKFSSGNILYNGVDVLDLSEYTYDYNEPSPKTIADYEHMIFIIHMQEHISDKDWELIEQYHNEIKKLKGEI